MDEWNCDGNNIEIAEFKYVIAQILFLRFWNLNSSAFLDF